MQYFRYDCIPVTELHRECHYSLRDQEKKSLAFPQIQFEPVVSLNLFFFFLTASFKKNIAWAYVTVDYYKITEYRELPLYPESHQLYVQCQFKLIIMCFYPSDFSEQTANFSVSLKVWGQLPSDMKNQLLGACSQKLAWKYNFVQ